MPGLLAIVFIFSLYTITTHAGEPQLPINWANLTEYDKRTLAPYHDPEHQELSLRRYEKRRYSIPKLYAIAHRNNQSGAHKPGLPT